MKLKLLLIATVMTIASSAFAQWFPARATAVVLPLQVQVQIFNPYYEPIACRGQVIGQTSYGQIVANSFFDAFIPAGQVRFGYVFTNTFNPFVAGRADIVCNFIRYY